MKDRSDPILKRQITPEVCAGVVAYLTRAKRWSVARIAKTLRTSPEFVRRVASGRQCFEYSDLETLGRAVGSNAHILFFRSLRREDFSDDLKGLYDITRDLVESGERFKRAMSRRSTSKRRGRTRAA